MSGSKEQPRPLLGLVYLLVVGLLVATSVAAYRNALPWQREAEVEFTTTQVGLGLRPLSDVKFQGVLVGEVSDVTTTGTRATVTLALDPDKIGTIPADVDAMVVPKTLFGEKYVDLRAVDNGGPKLAAGDTITQSETAVELGQIFDRLVPLLRTLQPERLAVILGSLAEILEGRGDDIARTLTTSDALLTELEPSYDDLVADIKLLGDTADVYAASTDDLMQILDNAATISAENLVPHEQDLEALLDAASDTADITEAVLEENGDRLVELNGRARAVLKVLDYYSSEVPCVLKALDYGNRLANLAAGVRGPYIPLSVDMIVDNRAYEYPKDLPTDPRSDANVKNLPAEVPNWEPHCPMLPKRVLALGKTPPPYSQPAYGQVFSGTSSRSRSGTTADPTAGAREALARAVAAESLGVDLTDLPAYAELLMLPLTSDGEVTLP